MHYLDHLIYGVLQKKKTVLTSLFLTVKGIVNIQAGDSWDSQGKEILPLQISSYRPSPPNLFSSPCILLQSWGFPQVHTKSPTHPSTQQYADWMIHIFSHVQNLIYWWSCRTWRETTVHLPEYCLLCLAAALQGVRHRKLSPRICSII